MAHTRKLGSAIIAAALAGAALAQITGCAEEEVTSQQVAAPNPAALYCQKSGGEHLILVRSDGSSQGVCRFPDGSEVDAWSMFRRRHQ